MKKVYSGIVGKAYELESHSRLPDCYTSGDRVTINRLIAPEDLPIGSLGTVRKRDDVCTDMVIIDWDAKWAGLYRPQHISKA